MTIEEIIIKALERPNVKRALKGKKIKRIVYVPNKLINFVTDEHLISQAKL